jgi:hypothetical protein
MHCNKQHIIVRHKLQVLLAAARRQCTEVMQLLPGQQMQQQVLVLLHAAERQRSGYG